MRRRWPSIALLFYLGEEFGQGGVESGRQLLHDQDRGHALAALQQANVVAVQVGLGAASASETILYSASASLILPVPASARPRPKCQNTDAVFIDESGAGIFRISFQ